MGAILVIAAILIIAFLVFVFVSINSDTKQVNATASSLDSKCEWQYLKHIDGLQIQKDTLTDLYATRDKLVLDSKSGRFEIPNERIEKYAIISGRQITQVEKSVVGRAIVGGILLGGVGAIVGALSANGTKEKVGKEEYFLIINYIDKNGETAAISFVFMSNPTLTSGLYNNKAEEFARIANSEFTNLYTQAEAINEVVTL